MIEAYCWPQSVVPGEPVALHLSTYAPTVQVEVARDGAEREVVWRGCGGGRLLSHPRRRLLARVRLARGARDPGRCRLAIRLLRRHGDRRRPARRRVPRRAAGTRAEPAPILMVLSTTTWNAYNDWGGPSLYTGGTRVSFERPIAPGFLVKPEPHRRKSQTDARPRGALVLRVGGAARALGLERWRRLVELGAAVLPLGRGERLPGRRGGLAGPRGAPRPPRRAPDAPLGRPRRVLVVGDARDGRDGSPPPAGTPRSSAATRATGRSGSRTTGGTWSGTSTAPTRTRCSARPRSGSSRAPGSTAGSAGRSSRRSGSRSPAAATRGTGSACRTRAAPTRSGGPTTGRSRAPISRYGDALGLADAIVALRGRRVRADADRRPPGADARRRRARDPRGPGDRAREALDPAGAAEPVRARTGRAGIGRDGDPRRGLGVAPRRTCATTTPPWPCSPRPEAARCSTPGAPTGPTGSGDPAVERITRNVLERLSR